MAKEKKRKQPTSDAAPPQSDGGKRRERKGKKPRKDKDKADAILPSQIKNKDKLSELHARLKREKKAQKRKLAHERDQAVRRATWGTCKQTLFEPSSPK